MIKQITTDVRFCDVCFDRKAYYECAGCKMDFCFECVNPFDDEDRMVKVVKFPTHVDFFASDDPIYCLDCIHEIGGKNEYLNALIEFNMEREKYLREVRVRKMHLKTLEERIRRIKYA